MTSMDRQGNSASLNFRALG